MSIRECMHLVSDSYFQLHKKDGSQAIQAVSENPMLHIQYTSPLCVCYRRQVIGMEFLTCTQADLSGQACIHYVITCCGPYSVL